MEVVLCTMEVFCIMYYGSSISSVVMGKNVVFGLGNLNMRCLHYYRKQEERYKRLSKTGNIDHNANILYKAQL